MAEGSTTQERVAARVGAPSRECVYHVRVLQPWASESTLSETCSSSSARDTSFFGLELELHGVQTGTDPPAAASLALAFNHSAQLRDAFTASSALATLVGPFSIRVASKRAATTERNKRVRQTFAAVQPGNTLFEINGVRFLAACSTVHDVYKQLMRVATRVSLATPFELTFARHNHAQAAAKIVPFAMRTDVQRAQVAQYAKMQAHDAALSDAVRRKKLCITQQIDYEQEQYLLSHIGHDLVALHDATMANGQWQAYEFDQALWYFHAPTARLYAEHPMRSSDATRQLLGAVQFQTRFAVQRLQRAVRIAHRRSALETAAVHHGKLLEAIWQDVWDHAWMRIWQDEACASEPIAPLGAGPEPEAAAEAPTDPLGVDQEIVQLVQRWRARTAKTSTGPPALTLADVVKHGIPSLRAQEPACVPASATDKQPVDAAMPSSLEESVLASSASPPPPSAPPVALARPPAVVLVDESTQTPTPRALPIERDADETKRIEEERPVGPTAVVLAPTDTSALALPAEALADEAKDEAEAATDNEGNDEEDDDDDDRREWRASLTLLKASLQHKKAASPPKHAAQHFYSLASSPTQRTRVDAVGAKRAPGRTSGDRDDDDERVLPRVAQIDGVRLRTSSTIVPPPRSSMTPFVLKKALHGPTGSAYKPLGHGDEDDEDDRALPAPASLIESVDAWPRSASFRAFHSFFAQRIDKNDDGARALPSTIDYVPMTPWPQAPTVLVHQQHQPVSQSSGSSPTASASSPPLRLLPSALSVPAPFASSGDYDMHTPLPSAATSLSYDQQQQPMRKALTATEIAILRHDRATYATAAGAQSPTKLPYIVRKKRPSPS